MIGNFDGAELLCVPVEGFVLAFDDEGDVAELAGRKGRAGWPAGAGRGGESLECEQQKGEC